MTNGLDVVIEEEENEEGKDVSITSKNNKGFPNVVD